MATQTLSSVVEWAGTGVQARAHVRGHQLTIDEPKPWGGHDAGPTPVELLLASLGGCLTVLVTYLAPQYEVTLTAVRVTIQGDIDPEGFRETNPSSRPGFVAIRYQVAITSPSPLDRVRALIAHAERVCPVKDTLHGVSITAESPTIALS